jgi:FkbM family methyltransferase
MHVEPCCQALLKEILPYVDPEREGLCIDVGVGTFAFYCEWFARLGFSTVAVEPLPVEKLQKLCQQHHIKLIKSCLSDQNGIQTLHLGRFAKQSNQNFNSLAPDWFGASSETKQVPTLDLASLLETIAAQKLTCLKLDVEGWESVIIKQLVNLPPQLRPKILMFEYGGGASRGRGSKGWSPKFLEATMTCLQTLQQSGYSFSIMVDYEAGTQAKVFDLRSLSLDQETLFSPQAVYGNIISFYDCAYSEPEIAKICAPYEGGWLHWLVGKIASA